MTRYPVRAKRWDDGWELHIEGIGVTQARTLATADTQVRNYLKTVLDVDVDADGVEVDIVPELDGLIERVKAAREHAAEAAAAQREAAAETRAVVVALRAAGLSVADIAVVMDVSRGRVSQLLAS